MQVKMILQEIERLPLRKRFLVIQQTLKSIEKEEKMHSETKDFLSYENESNIQNMMINEKSLSEDWMSDEDNRWDKFLQ